MSHGWTEATVLFAAGGVKDATRPQSKEIPGGKKKEGLDDGESANRKYFYEWGKKRQFLVSPCPKLEIKRQNISAYM